MPVYIAVHDALRMRSLQPVGNLYADIHSSATAMGLPRNAMLQRLALEQFHGDKRAALKLTNVINRANVRMIQRRGRARFTPESFDRLSILRYIVRQEFQRDVSPKPRVLGLIHHAHATAAQFFQHSVMSYRPTSHRGSVSHRP